MIRVYHLRSHVTLWSCGHVRSHNKWQRFIFLSMKPTTNKYDRLVVYDQGPFTIKAHYPSIICSYEVTLQIKTLYFLFHQVYSHQTWQAGESRERVQQLQSHNNPLIILSCELIWQMKNVISSFLVASGDQTWEGSTFDTRGYYPQNHNDHFVMKLSSNLKSHMTCRSLSHVMSQDLHVKQKMIHLTFYKAYYYHQTWLVACCAKLPLKGAWPWRVFVRSGEK